MMRERIIIERDDRGYKVELQRDPRRQEDCDYPLTAADMAGFSKFFDFRTVGEVMNFVERKFTRATFGQIVGSEPPPNTLIAHP